MVKKVTAFPSIPTLAQQLGKKSERTIVRWIRELEQAKVVRSVPQYTFDGAQTSNVVIFNASYPEIPEMWDTFAPNGFVLVNKQPMLFEDYVSLKQHILKQGKTT